MLSATFLDLTSDEIMTIGEILEGDVYQGYCCDGFSWEVLLVFTNDDPDYNSIWGRCQNQACPAIGNPSGRYQPDIDLVDPYQGVSSVLQCDFAEWLAMATGDVEPEARR